MARIAHLIESDGPGGAERVLADLALGLQSEGNDNLVILPEHGEGWLAQQLAGSGIAVEYFRLTHPFSPACARSLAATLRRHAIDLAHSHEFSLAVYGSWASWLAGVHHVITMHGSRYYAHRLRRRLAMRAAAAASAQLVAVSNLLADQMSADLRMPRSRIAMVPNGVRHLPGDGSAVRQELGLGRADRLLVAVGNLYPVKGHRHVLEAMDLMRDPSVHLAICGRGDLASELTNEARALGLSSRVHLLGLRSDVADVLAAADVYVHPSLSEGLPLALLEAMFARRPVVASAVGEVPTALANGDAGVLVPPADARALAAAVNRLLRHPDEADALAGRAAWRACEEYDVSRMVARYRGIYERVIRKPPAVSTATARRYVRTVAGRACGASPRFWKSLSGRALILMYHRVLPQPELAGQFVQPGMYVTPETFEQHLKWLTTHFNVVSLRSLLDTSPTDSWDDASRHCVITFDDGWLDNYTYAYPLLKKYGVPATVFLPTGLIGTREWLWSDRLGHVLRAGRVRDSDGIIERAKRLSAADRHDLITRLSQRFGASWPDERCFLNWDEVREMAGAGIDFASHTCSHAILTSLDAKAMSHELRGSLEALSREVPDSLPVIAYPNGNHAPDVVQAARDAGYAAALTTQPGVESRDLTDRFRLRRIGVHEDVSHSIDQFTFHIARQVAAGSRLQ